MNYFIITKKVKTASGLWDLNLDAYVDGKHVGNLVINSGIAGRQHFRTFKEQHVGELEPIPEGEYDLGSLEWAGGRGNYTTLFQEIKSPIWVTVVRSRAIGFHLDGNRDLAPGSAGCPVFKTMTDLKTFVKWWEKFGPFTKCYVDWGLKYVKLPTQKASEDPAPTEPQEEKPVATAKEDKTHWAYPVVKDLNQAGIVAGKGKNADGSIHFGLYDPIDFGTAAVLILSCLDKAEQIKPIIAKHRQKRG